MVFTKEKKNINYIVHKGLNVFKTLLVILDKSAHLVFNLINGLCKELNLLFFKESNPEDALKVDRFLISNESH